MSEGVFLDSDFDVFLLTFPNEMSIQKGMVFNHVFLRKGRCAAI